MKKARHRGMTFAQRVVLGTFLALLWALVGAPWFGAVVGAQTPSSCEEAVSSWAGRCPEIRAECVRPILCPAGGVILEAGCQPDDHLRVEVSHATPRAFRRVGDLGVSPVGDFPDWSEVAAGKRRVLDAIEVCLAKDPSLLVPARSSPSVEPRRSAASTDTPIPWRLLLGMALGAIVCIGRWRRARDGRMLGLLGALFAATFLFRWLAFPAAFFHMNGQGAFWIGFALDTNGRLSSYGPGYWELYGGLAQVPIASPERLILGAQALAGAFSSVCAWIVARGVGGSRVLAWAGAGVVAASPILTRISQSQSYYGTWTALLFIATALLVLGCPRKGERPRLFLLAVAGAGFLVAQAARVTPVGWAPAAMLPLAVAARPGELRAQLRWMVVAALGIGAVVVLTSGQAMLGVLRGSLGAQWLPQVALGGFELVGLVRAGLLVSSVVVFASRRRAHAATRLLALAGALCLMDVTCLVRAHPESFHRAYFSMWSPVLLGLVVALVADLRVRALRVVASAGLLVAAVALHARTWHVERELPTNVLEALWAEEWRERLPPGATVVYLGRVRPHVLALPLHGAHTRVKIEPWVLTHEDAMPNLGQLGPDVYYYESSLCAAREARGFCRDFRSRYTLSPLETKTLPARSSGSTPLFEDATVSVGLYRIR